MVGFSVSCAVIGQLRCSSALICPLRLLISSKTVLLHNMMHKYKAWGQSLNTSLLVSLPPSPYPLHKILSSSATLERLKTCASSSSLAETGSEIHIPELFEVSGLGVVIDDRWRCTGSQASVSVVRKLMAAVGVVLVMEHSCILKTRCCLFCLQSIVSQSVASLFQSPSRLSQEVYVRP